MQSAYGRLFTAADDRPSAHGTAILTWSLFQRRLGGSPNAIGRKILLDGKPYTVIGVLPQWFTYPDVKNQAWLPAFQAGQPNIMESYSTHMWNVVARLRPAVDQKQTRGIRGDPKTRLPAAPHGIDVRRRRTPPP